MLDLVRLSPCRLFPPGGVELYRQIALLTEMGPGQEVLDAGCGRGVPLEYFAREFEVHGIVGLRRFTGAGAGDVDEGPEISEEERKRLDEALHELEAEEEPLY